MKLCNKYNIPQETIDKMVKDGIISCSWPRYEKIYESFKAFMRTSPSRGQAIRKVSDQENISERHIRDIIAKFE